MSTRPVLWLSAALAAVALVLPISTVNDLIKPDERFVAPALLLAVAALPYRPGRLRMTALGPALAAAVVALHLVEYVDVGQRIAHGRRRHRRGRARRHGRPHLTVPSRYGCDPTAGPVTGVPVLKWFAVDHALEGGPARVNVEETSLVHARRSVPPDATVLTLDVPDVATAVLPAAVPTSRSSPARPTWRRSGRCSHRATGRSPAATPTRSSPARSGGAAGSYPAPNPVTSPPHGGRGASTHRPGGGG